MIELHIGIVSPLRGVERTIRFFDSWVKICEQTQSSEQDHHEDQRLMQIMLQQGHNQQCGTE